MTNKFQQPTVSGITQTRICKSKTCRFNSEK